MAKPKHEAGEIDWTKLKSEYATTGISYRVLPKNTGWVRRMWSGTPGRKNGGMREKVS